MMKNNKKNLTCPVQTTSEVLGGKWKLVILHYLIDGNPKRFNELESIIEGISPKMLVKELKDLEHNLIIKREQFRTIPPKVEYSLTEYGKSVVPLINVLKMFGEQHINLMNQ